MNKYTVVPIPTTNNNNKETNVYYHKTNIYYNYNGIVASV